MATVYPSCVNALLVQLEQVRNPMGQEEQQRILARWLYDHDVPMTKELREIINIPTPDHSSPPRR